MSNWTTSYASHGPEITPTLFIGLGGTGNEVVRRVRQRILEHAWRDGELREKLESLDQFPLAQFLYYDVDCAYLTESVIKDRAGAQSVDFMENEKTPYRRLDLDKYFRSSAEIHNFPLIADWLPLTYRLVNELGIDPSKSTAQMRWLSRLNFFDNYPAIKATLEDKIRTLMVSSSLQTRINRFQLDVDSNHSRIVVIGSAAGGAGSGAFLDMGYLAKWLAKRVTEYATVDLHLLLPGGFLGAKWSGAQANTYAALMELETSMIQATQFIKGWEYNDHHDLPPTPYDDIFLIDNTNVLGKEMPLNDVFEMMAENLFDDLVPCEFSTRKRSIRVCHCQYKLVPFYPAVDVDKYGQIQLMYSKAYSVFGRASIRAGREMPSDDVPGNSEADPSVITMLEGMSEAERRSVIENCLASAFPWVDADIRDVNPESYMCIVGVKDAELFDQKFGDEFRMAALSSTGMPSTKVQFRESDRSDKLVCYVEISGIPLTALTQLLNWRQAYEDMGKRFPVHIHKDRSLFVHPLVPTSAELDRLSSDFGLFIQGIALGILKREPENVEDMGGYSIAVSGEDLCIGNERRIRQFGFNDDLRQHVQSKLARSLEAIQSPAQYSALIALYEYYERRAYSKRFAREGRYEERCGTLPNTVCRKLKEEALSSFKKRYPGHGSPFDLHDSFSLDAWSEVIGGSEHDAYNHEVNRDHLPKRRIIREVFRQGWLENHLGLGSAPPPLPIQVWVALNGQPTGPFDLTQLRQMITLGNVCADNLVWMQGMGNWAPACKVDAVAPLFYQTTGPI